MVKTRVERRLAAILAADVAGYSRLVAADEEGTLARFKTIRADLVDPKINEHYGRIVKTTGDGLLAEFSSVIDALRCAIEVQAGMTERNAAVPGDRRIEWRIGINVGDIVVEDGDIFGDGVNIAARLESLAEPGGICVSARVQEDADGKLDVAFEDAGEQQLHNITRPVRIYRVGTGVASRPSLPLPDKPSIAVLAFTNMSCDPEQEFFADGISEDIITVLSKSRSLFVIARHSSFTYKGKKLAVNDIGRELGVRYVLEGSVRKAELVGIAQLIEAPYRRHLWAEVRLTPLISFAAGRDHHEGFRGNPAGARAQRARTCREQASRQPRRVGKLSPRHVAFCECRSVGKRDGPELLSARDRD
jgi:adenylate cyclase